MSRIVSQLGGTKINGIPVTIIFLVTCSFVAFLVDTPTQDSDMLFYYYSGKQILSGDGENVQIFNGPVGWPILLATSDTLIDDPFITAKLFSIGFSTGIVFISYFIIRNVFGEKIALLGQIIIAVNPLFHQESIINHLEMLPVFLIFVALYFVTKEKLSQKHIIFCGIFLGLSFMLRPQSLLVGFGILIFILSSIKKQKKYFTLYFILAFLLVTSPLMFYNISVTGNILDTTPDFYLSTDGSFETEYYESFVLENQVQIPIITNTTFNYEKYFNDYFENLLYYNPHLFLNLDLGYNNFSTISFIPYNGILFVLGGIFGLFWASGFSFRKIKSNVRPLLIIPLFFLLSISIVKINVAGDLFGILIILGTFSAFFILNTLPKIITKIQNFSKINSKTITNFFLVSIIFIIISCNLVSSFMIVDNLLFGIPVDYHNLLDLEKNRELIALEYKEVGDILSKEPDIENKIVMATSVNYAHYAKSKFLYYFHDITLEADNLSSFISRENWSEYDIKVSNVASIPKDRYGVNQPIVDYLIYEISTESNKNLQILENPNHQKIPANFELFYISKNGETIIYKINHSEIP